MIRSRRRSKPMFSFPHKLLGFRVSIFPKRETNNGVNVNETTKLISVEKTTTSENSRKILPIKPPVKASGTNTTTSTNVMAKAVKPISLRPSRAAVRLSLPISRCRLMFSKTTIESSTRIPTTNESAMSVIILSEKPATYINKNVGMMDEGKATNTNNDERKLCRNRSITTETIKMAKNKSSTTA